MASIRSIEDLDQAESQAIERQRQSAAQYRFNLCVGISSCGLAVGAGDTLDEIKRLLARERLSEVQVSVIGCNGQCALEPIVQVKETNRAPVTYGRVTPEVARRIIQRHIRKGQILQENVIENP